MGVDGKMFFVYIFSDFSRNGRKKSGKKEVSCWTLYKNFLDLISFEFRKLCFVFDET